MMRFLRRFWEMTDDQINKAVLCVCTMFTALCMLAVIWCCYCHK